MYYFRILLCFILNCSFCYSLKNNERLFTPTETQEYPRIIWTYYNGKMPYYIKEMLDITMNNLNKTWEYIFLTMDNLNEYIDNSSLPPHFSQIVPQHQSDIVRLNLLNKYGGWWMDTGIIVNNPGEIERIYRKVTDKQADFYGVCIYECPLRDVETSFIYAKRGSNIIKNWLEELEESYRIGEENYIYKVYREGVNVPTLVFKQYPYISPYLLIFAAFEKAIFRRTPRNASIIIESGWDNIYSLYKYARENNMTYKKVYLNEEKRRSFDIIKISGWFRVKLFKEKKVTGFESYEPFPLKTGCEGGELVKRRMIIILIIRSVMYSLFLLIFLEIINSIHIKIFVNKNKSKET